MAQSNLDFETLAKDNVRTLNVPEPVFNKPLIVVMVGIPASGKSTLAKKLAEEFPLSVFSEEYMTSFLSPRATLLKRNSVEVFQLAVKTIEILIRKGKASIYDANTKTRQQRDLIKAVVEKIGGTYLLIYLDCPKEVCYQRLQKHNLEVTRGESKGFILDRDLFEYEVSRTRAPASDEINVVYSCTNAQSFYKISSLVREALDQK